MANLKEIRDRIKSVKNTRKITEAMRLVAAAKVRRAQEQVLRSRPFADRLTRVLENLQSRMQFEDADSPLLEQRPVETVTLVAVTGDRGLCGGYNSNILKRTEKRFAELKAKGVNVKVVLIGKKAVSYFGNRNYPTQATFSGLEQVPTADEANTIATDLLSEFIAQGTDRVEIVFTKFINLVSCKPVIQTLLPLDPQDIADPEDEIFRLTTKDGRLTVETGTAPGNAEPKMASDIIFEQSPGQLLNALLPLFLQNQIRKRQLPEHGRIRPFPGVPIIKKEGEFPLGRA